jgi:putative tryptophan/tyrosine transport system substrate-binding protein
MKKLVWLNVVIVVLATVLMADGLVFSANKSIALLWAGKSTMPRNVMMGFRNRLRELAPDIEVKTSMDVKSMSEAEQLFRQYEQTMDGIVFLRSDACEFLAGKTPKVPCFIGACNNPQELGCVKNLQAPEGKVTGVSYFIPYEKRFQVIKELFPNVKSVALLAEKGHPAAKIDQDGTREQCKRLGIKYQEVLASNVRELVDGAAAVAGSVDLFIMASNKLINDNTTSLLAMSNQSKKPLFAYAYAPVKRGVVAGMAARDDYLGGLLAESVIDVLVKGKPISQVPVKTDPDPEIGINEMSMKGFGLTFPQSIMSKAKIYK